MRTNEPASAEYFSKTIGTRQTQKITSRQKQGIMGSEVTGDGSIRDAEEFMVHPNVFKNELGRGEAIVILPHEKGSKSVQIKFGIRKNLEAVGIPKVYKANPELLIIKDLGNTSQSNSDTEDNYDQNITTLAASKNIKNNIEQKEAS